VVEEVRRQLQLDIVILDQFDRVYPGIPIIVARTVMRNARAVTNDIRWKRFTDLESGELLEQERAIVEQILSRAVNRRGLFSGLDWIKDVHGWCAQGIECKPAEIRIRQINGSSHSALLRLEVADGRLFWFKGGGEPEEAEYPLTKSLFQTFPEYLPTALAHHDDWNAWLMEDAGMPLEGLVSARPRLLQEVGRQLASLHRQSGAAIPLLLRSGASDQRSCSLSLHIPAILERLSWAEQGDIHSTRSSVQKQHNLKVRLENVVAELDDLRIPNALVHGDLNFSNILIDEGTCLFIDWANSSIGNPLANLEQLKSQVLYDRQMATSVSRLISGYERAWTEQFSGATMGRALALIPPIALCMYLHSRRRWFAPGRIRDANFVRFARNMSLQLERAVMKVRGHLAVTA
jgi:tRNA A-37 threonylcarbamoyl transferase component Bud32